VLTAAGALGDFRTVDFCSMLDAAGDEPVSSFELCRGKVDGLRRVVGPPESGMNTEVEPYDHPGDLPGGVLAAIEGGGVRHVSYGPDPFGSLDPCELISGPEFGPRDADSLESRQGGHYCTNGRVGLYFEVREPNNVGTPETVGGRAAVLDSTGDSVGSTSNGRSQTGTNSSSWRRWSRSPVMTRTARKRAPPRNWWRRGYLDSSARWSSAWIAGLGKVSTGPVGCFESRTAIA
jgi:hypothetical protein